MNDQEQEDEHGGRAGPDAVHEDAVEVDGDEAVADDEDAVRLAGVALAT
jgi:hypothetical protein